MSSKSLTIHDNEQVAPSLFHSIENRHNTQIFLPSLNMPHGSELIYFFILNMQCESCLFPKLYAFIPSLGVRYDWLLLPCTSFLFRTLLHLSLFLPFSLLFYVKHNPFTVSTFCLSVCLFALLI